MKDIENGRASKSNQAKKRKPLHTLRTNFRRQNGFGPIDLEDFRIPKARIQSPRSKARVRRSPTHSDGFEGAEARPIGRLMPVKKPSRGHNAIYKTTTRVGELTCASDRAFGEEYTPINVKTKWHAKPMEEANKENEQKLLKEDILSIVAENEAELAQKRSTPNRSLFAIVSAQTLEVITFH